MPAGTEEGLNTEQPADSQATQEAAALAEEQAFQAGFDDVQEESPGAAPETPPAATETPSPEPEPPAPPATPPLTVEALQQELTRVHEAQEQRIRQLFGKLGEVGSVIQKLQAVRQQGGFKLPDGGLKRLSAEFPEMAKFLQEDLSEVLAQANPASSPDELRESMRPAIEEIFSDIEQKLERRLLTKEHKDWQQVVASDLFSTWKKTVLPPNEAAELDESWDSGFIGEKLTAFKAWKATQEAAVAERQKRLEEAITPASGGRTPSQKALSDEEAFLAGFNA